jgi:hypothetical protein
MRRYRAKLKKERNEDALPSNQSAEAQEPRKNND